MEIDNFISFLKPNIGSKFTKSAFVQARMKVKPEVFKKLSQTLIDEFYTDNDKAIKLWEEFRLLAIDGSRITLPITNELKSIYGDAKNQTTTGIVQARCSVIYDVKNNYVLGGILAPLNSGERKLALSHLLHCKSNDLLIYDRGYPSYGFIYKHIKKDLNFLMRVKVSFNQVTIDFESSKKKSQIVTFYPRESTSINSIWTFIGNKYSLWKI